MDIYAKLTEDLQKACPTLELRENEPMARHTTFRIGGPARLMALPKSGAEAQAALQAAAGLGVEPIFVGNGSNLLVADAGVTGFVVKAVDGLGELRCEGNSLYAGAGVLLSTLSGLARDHSLTGLEFAHGIPGSVGGAVTMNAGAYNGEMGAVVREVDCLEADGTRRTLSGDELAFSYRHSAFSDGRRFILGARMELTPGDPVSIQMLMDDFGNRRRHKQPLNLPSAGSTFKRPEGYFAAALIDECKLKGTTIGGAQVSKKHAGFLVNAGGATCSDVLALVDLVRETVLRETGVALELEVKTLGI